MLPLQTHIVYRILDKIYAWWNTTDRPACRLLVDVAMSSWHAPERDETLHAYYAKQQERLHTLLTSQLSGRPFSLYSSAFSFHQTSVLAAELDL